MSPKGKLAIYWAASCGGCEISILGINEKILDVAGAFDIVFCPCIMDGKVRETQLFNLKENPEEFIKDHHDPQVRRMAGIEPKAHQVNLAGNPKYAKKLAEMEKLLLEEMRRLDDPYRLWDQPDDGLTPPVKKSRKNK